MYILICLMEMTEYVLGDMLFVNKKINRYSIYLIGFAGYVLFFCFFHPLSLVKYVTITVLTVLCNFVSLNEDIRSRVLHTCVVFFVVSAMKGVAHYLTETYIVIPCGITNDELSLVITSGFCLALCALFLYIKVKMSDPVKSRINRSVDGLWNIVTLCSACIVMIAISLLDYSVTLSDHVLYNQLALKLCGVAYFCIGLLGGITLYIKNSKDKIQMLAQNEAMLNGMQKAYYEALLERENETKAYRHDMNNHLVCLLEMSKRGEMDRLTRYLNDMVREMTGIQRKQYCTGTDILDILTNYYIPQLSEKIKISLTPGPAWDTSEMKICTIYANLLQNAVEELNSDRERSGQLTIAFRKEGEMYRILMENSIFRDKGNGRLLTKKEDRENHGMGLKNVSRIVEELKGKLHIFDKGTVFSVLVELPQNGE